MHSARTFLILCGLFCLAASFKSAYYDLPSYNNRRFISNTIPLNEPFISGLYVGLFASGDVGPITYYTGNRNLNDLFNDPTEYLYLIIYNDRGESLYYRWLGGNSDRILTTINGEYCYNPNPFICVSPGPGAQSYNGVGQSGALVYGYLYIPDRVAEPFLNGVNTLYTVFGWGSGVNYLTSGYRTSTPDDATFVLSFNPALLVGDPHLQTDYGLQESIPTLGGDTEEGYALYCDAQGNWINGVVHNTLAGAYILTELELDVVTSSGRRYTISGYRDSNGFPYLSVNNGIYYFETYDSVGLELYDYDLQMMTWVQSDDPEFDGELARYYRRVMHLFYLYNSGTGDQNRLTVRVGYHPQMKGFFEVLVSPVPNYVPLAKVETGSQASLHTRNTIIPVDYNRPGGLLYKDPGDSLSTYAIPDITQNVCVGL